MPFFRAEEPGSFGIRQRIFAMFLSLQHVASALHQAMSLALLSMEGYVVVISWFPS